MVVLHFVRSAHVKQHSDNVIEAKSEKPEKCGYCGLSFGKAELFSHLKEHLDNPSLISKAESNATVSPGESKAEKCGYCGRAFGKTELLSHLKVHM